VGVLSRLGLAALVVLVVGIDLGRLVAAQGPLRSPQGSYRGRVIEAGSGQPIAGAGVFMVWSASDESGAATPFAYREAQTDTQGQFSIDAVGIEQNLPPRALSPQLWVYRPGYDLYPDRDVHPAGAPATPLTQPGAVVRLIGARTDTQRVEALNDFVAVINRYAPTGGPILLGLIESEFRRLEPAHREKPIAAVPAPAPPPGGRGPCDVDPKNPPPLASPKPPKIPEPGTYNPFEGRRAPYYGRVVDAQSGVPLSGAVIVTAWTRRVIYPFHAHSVFHDSCEVLTDTNGGFVVDARVVEASRSRGLEPPTFVVFFPGYSAHGGAGSNATSGTSFIRGDYQAFHGVTIGLVKLTTRQERLATISAVRPPEVPASKIRNLTRLVNVERAALGLHEIPVTEDTK
jgi:hypothetical protein